MKILIVLVLLQNLVMGKIQIPSESGLDLFNNMMRYLFENCRSEFGSLGFWGNDRIFLADDEADFVLFNDENKTNELPTRRMKFLVANLEEPNYYLPGILLHYTNITLEIETTFIFDKGGFNFDNMMSKFIWYQYHFNNSKVYYCFEEDDKLTIVTLNALANVSSPLWDYWYSNIEDDMGTEWNYFKTNYYRNNKFHHGSELCKNIFFDRTKILNGYKIKASAILWGHYELGSIVVNELITKTTNISYITSLIHPIDGQLAKALVDYFNVSVNITYGTPMNFSFDPSRLIQDHLIELDLSSRICVPSRENFEYVMNNYIPQSLFFFYDIIVTHNRGLMTPLEKMFEFYGWLTIFATMIILFITLIVIYLSTTKNASRLSFAVFECLRLLISNSIHTRMNSNKMRIFFSVIFLYFLIIQATFSGHLAAFLTKSVYRKNVETLEDLKDPRYSKIYAPFEAENYIEDKELLNKTTFGDYTCKDVISDPSIVCIDQEKTLIYFIAKYNLHTPKNPVMFSYGTQLMHHNWALRHKFNKLIMNLAQSGISDLWYRNVEKSTEEALKEIEDTAQGYPRPIQVEDVTFALVLLIVGLFFSFICFIVENSIKISKLI